MKKKVTLLNMGTSLLLQLCTIISGLILPKIILSNFGSEVNGLVSSLNQFLSYITLLEGGVGAVISANLYKPIYEKDQEKISSIIVTSNMFFKKIGFLFIIYSFVLATVYPIIFHINFSYMYVFSLTMILSIGLFIQYMFAVSLRTFLVASKEGYIVYLVQILMVILNIIFAIISIKIFPNIHILKFISNFLFILQPICYKFYVNKHYNINYKAKKDNMLIKNRWDGFAINLASFIHSSTDVTILTIFTNLTLVSVYSVYSFVTTGIKQLINALTSGFSPVLGQAYASNNVENINEKLDLFEYIVLVFVFFPFTVAGLLITPFVMIYTKNITDANYYQPLFGVLIVLAEAINLLKIPHLTFSNIANKFKEVSVPAFIEAGINVLISIILAPKMGILGVAIGTIVAMLYRFIFHVWFMDKIYKHRKNWKYFLKILIFSVSTILVVGICSYCAPLTHYDIISWILHACIYSVVAIVIYALTSILFFKKEVNEIKSYLKH